MLIHHYIEYRATLITLNIVTVLHTTLQPSPRIITKFLILKAIIITVLEKASSAKVLKRYVELILKEKG